MQDLTDEEIVYLLSVMEHLKHSRPNLFRKHSLYESTREKLNVEIFDNRKVDQRKFFKLLYSIM